MKLIPQGFGFNIYMPLLDINFLGSFYSAFLQTAQRRIVAATRRFDQSLYHLRQVSSDKGARCPA
jgi:hypothetical protein